jgi:NAD(P)-dependent dehydrogenase (short-subunit alcohol dehydrogenase family)
MPEEAVMTDAPVQEATPGRSPSDGPLTRRRALVTGSGGALGTRICLALAAGGAAVAGLDVSADAAAAPAEKLVAAGAKARQAAVDLLDFDRLKTEVDAVAAAWAASTSWSTPRAAAWCGRSPS